MMGPQDGVDHALRALAALRAKRDDWHALFLGDGDVVPAMRELTRELGLEDVVTFGGMADDELIGRTLATADVCLSPEPSNPLNDVSTMIKVAEYMAAGRPVVAYELPETRATAGDAALYARRDDPVDFAERIQVLLSRPDLRGSMGALARQKVERALSWDVSRRELEAAYRYLLPDRPLRVSTTHADANVTSHAVA
jgi:glycosyltransferase involved in cell wall biosynthesis